MTCKEPERNDNEYSFLTVRSAIRPDSWSRGPETDPVLTSDPYGGLRVQSVSTGVSTVTTVIPDPDPSLVREVVTTPVIDFRTPSGSNRPRPQDLLLQDSLLRLLPFSVSPVSPSLLPSSLPRSLSLDPSLPGCLRRHGPRESGGWNHISSQGKDTTPTLVSPSLCVENAQVTLRNLLPDRFHHSTHRLPQDTSSLDPLVKQDSRVNLLSGDYLCVPGPGGPSLLVSRTVLRKS